MTPEIAALVKMLRRTATAWHLEAADAVTALQAEVERLNKQLGECQGSFETAGKEVEWWKDRAEAAERRVKELREALEPFVDRIASDSLKIADDAEIFVRMGWLRRARAAYKGAG